MVASLVEAVKLRPSTTAKNIKDSLLQLPASRRGGSPLPGQQAGAGDQNKGTVLHVAVNW
jgi:hypothetical protein